MWGLMLVAVLPWCCVPGVTARTSGAEVSTLEAGTDTLATAGADSVAEITGDARTGTVAAPSLEWLAGFHARTYSMRCGRITTPSSTFECRRVEVEPRGLKMMKVVGSLGGSEPLLSWAQLERVEARSPTGWRIEDTEGLAMLTAMVGTVVAISVGVAAKGSSQHRLEVGGTAYASCAAIGISLLPLTNLLVFRTEGWQVVYDRQVGQARP